MRDRDRIDDICHRLAVVWKRSPDIRLGQIVSNAVHFHKKQIQDFTPPDGAVWNDPFYIEDDELIKSIEREGCTCGRTDGRHTNSCGLKGGGG